MSRRPDQKDPSIGCSAEFLELLDRYLVERQERRTMMATTARLARYALYPLGRALGDRPVSTMTAADADAFMAASAGLAPQTQRGRLAAARMFVLWLQRHELLDHDPFRDVQKPRLPRTKPRALPATAVRDVFEAATTPRDRLILSLMVNEGLRCVEVARLQLADVDERDRTLRVTGKGLHERVLPITSETASCLAIYLDSIDIVSGPLIRDARWHRNPITAQRISEVVARIMRDAGVKRRRHDRVSAHALRHTAATDMLRRGAHVRDVQAVLGHANLQTTQHYLPLVVNDLRGVMDGRSYRFPEIEAER